MDEGMAMQLVWGSFKEPHIYPPFSLVSSKLVTRGKWETHFEGNHFLATWFTDGHLHDSTFVGCHFDMSGFRFCRLSRVTFRRCAFLQCRIVGCILSEVRFEDCIGLPEFEDWQSKHSLVVVEEREGA